MLTELRKLIDEDSLVINGAKLKVFSRINHPENLLEDETYFVDQDAGEFQVKYNDKVVFRSDLHIIGTWSQSMESFLWSWHNSSIKEENYRAIKEKMSSVDTLKDVLEQAKLTGESDYFYFQMCNWIATHCGYQGVYPASYEGNVTVFVAVNLEPVDYNDAGRVCIMCMCREHQADFFVASDEEFGICSRCIGNLVDMAAIDARDGESLSDVIDRKCSEGNSGSPFIPCQLCQTPKPEVPVVAGGYTGICYNCVRLAVDIFQKQ